ncbi:MAG: hypothetical protein ACOCUS_06385 [Polyangiales bacterium]
MPILIPVTVKVSGTKTILLLCSCAVLALPSTASAEEPARKHGMHETATNLVDQVMVAIDAVRHKPSEGSAAREQAAHAEDARAREATDRGVVPYARTVYDLLRGKFELGSQHEGEAAGAETEGGDPVFLQVKPKSYGGYLRCEFRF